MAQGLLLKNSIPVLVITWREVAKLWLCDNVINS